MALKDLLPFSLPARGSAASTQPQSSNELLGHTPPMPDPGTVRPRVGAIPFGQSGRANFYGLPQWDELNPALIGPQGIRLLDQVYYTDAHIRRLVLAAWTPLTAGTWTLEPYGGEDAIDSDRKIAEAIWWMLSEWMSPGFYEHLAELGPVLLRSGFAPYEQMWAPCDYKGKTLIGPKKLGLRLPRTIWQWWQDDFGDLTHIGQILPNRPAVIIPASELCYYRLAAEGDNWVGTSLLRHAYKHWYIKDKLERLDAIGQERKAVGMPVVYHSPDIAEDILNGVETALANMHVSEVAYLMLPGFKMGTPAAEGAVGNQWLVDVIKFDSSAGEGISKSLDYHQTAISASFLTDFLELGHHQVGARATAEVQQDPFLTAINGCLLPPVIPVINRLVDRIRKLNWENAEGSPTLQLTLNDDASLSEISTYVQQLVMSEAMQVDPDLEDWLRERAGLPPANADVRTQVMAAKQAGLEAAANAAKQSQQVNNGDVEPPNPDKPPPGPQSTAARTGQQQSVKPPGNSQRTSATGEQERKRLEQASKPVAAGVIVQANDTGRVLMIKRTDDKHDPGDARARWEFPGGKLDLQDPDDWAGAHREWCEETGGRLPNEAIRAGSVRSPDGAYQAHVVWIPAEAGIALGAHDRHEVSDVGWKDPDSLASDPAVRGKVQEMLPAVSRALQKQLDKAERDRVHTVAVDFDGVIHTKDPNGQGHDPQGPPVKGAVAGMKALARAYDVVIFTARKHLKPVKRWLEANGLGQFSDAVTNVKPIAQWYIDDHNFPDGFPGWDVVGQKLLDADAVTLRVLDAPRDPPNLRWSTDPAKRCATCDMFWNAACGGYWCKPVHEDQTCDEWVISRALAANPKTPAGVTLDGDAPLGGGVASESGLQMVPDIAAKVCSCGKGPYRDGRCRTCGGTRPPSFPARKLDTTASEPTAKWFERLLSQDRLRDALDGARDHIEASVGPAALKAARRMAYHVSNGIPVQQAVRQAADPAGELTGSLASHYAGMYRLGHETVATELARQRRALARTLDEPPGDTAAGAGASRLNRTRQRGEHSARNIANKVAETLGRQQIQGLQDQPTLTAAAEQAAASALRVEALANTAASINDGRYDGAMSDGQVVGAYYTSVLDPSTCGACEKADDGTLLSIDDAVTLGPPNPDCDGADRCRCMLLWVLSSDPAALAAA